MYTVYTNVYLEICAYKYLQICIYIHKYIDLQIQYVYIYMQYVYLYIYININLSSMFHNTGHGSSMNVETTHFHCLFRPFCC